MIVERYGYLGGLATGGLVLLMDEMFDRQGRRCIGGVTAISSCSSSITAAPTSNTGPT